MEVELFIPDPAVTASERNLKNIISRFEAIYRSNCRKLNNSDLSEFDNAREILNIKERIA